MPRSLAFLKTVLPWVFLGVLWYPYPAQALNCTQPPDQTTPACIGQWTPPFPSGPPAAPTVVVHMSVLPNGKVLLWSRAGAAGGGFNGTEPVLTWDPITDQYEVGPSIDDIFCSGHALLPDGRLLVAGGTLAGAAVAGAYDGATQTWGQWVPMNNKRYYPSNLPLANGEQLVIAGGIGKNAQGKNVENTIPQVWTLNGTFRNLTGANKELPQYPWLSLAPDGRVFIAGPQPTNYWLNTSGAGTITQATALGHPVWKAFRVAGVPVTFAPGKVLITGGANRNVTPVQTTQSCELIDLNQNPPQWQQVGGMAQPRVDHMAMVLPTSSFKLRPSRTGVSLPSY